MQYRKKIELYTKKLVVSGHTMELYEYSEPLCLGLRPDRVGRVAVRSPKPRSAFSLQRTKQKLRRMIQANEGMDKFITLTFKENIQDFDVANACFAKFIKDFQFFTGLQFRYVCVPEFQKRGAIHFHILADFPFYPYQFLKSFWSYGSLNIQRVRSVQAISRYFTKYVSKEFCDIRFYGKKLLYYPYKLMKKSVVVLGDFVDFVLLKVKHEIVFNVSYKGEWTPSCNFSYMRIL